MAAIASDHCPKSFLKMPSPIFPTGCRLSAPRPHDFILTLPKSFWILRGYLVMDEDAISDFRSPPLHGGDTSYQSFPTNPKSKLWRSKQSSIDDVKLGPSIAQGSADFITAVWAMPFAAGSKRISGSHGNGCTDRPSICLDKV